MTTLVSLFLFGLAVEREEVIKAIGSKDMTLLMDAALLCESPANSSNLVAEVQVYPICRKDFHCTSQTTKEQSEKIARMDETYLFLTDWPMESLRDPRFAIMPVGYDSLELLSLSAVGDVNEGRILDLCCGNGIQGLFSWICSGGETIHSKLREFMC